MVLPSALGTGFGASWMKSWLVIVIALLAAGVGAAAVWAYDVLFAEQVERSASKYTLATVETGEIGASITLNAVAHWPTRSAGINRARGVVTDVRHKSGTPVREGDVLYTVNLEPVVLGAGKIPPFRTQRVGVRGADVEQLQDFLDRLGYPVGDPPGSFQASTAAAVRAWQAGTGATVDGVVDPGDIIFVRSSFPRAIVFETISVGSTLGGGETVVSLLAKTPRFTMPVTASQAAVMPADTSVVIDGPGGERWDAMVASQRTNPSTSQVEVRLVSGDADQPVCGQRCDAIPTTGSTRLLSKVVTVEPTRGLVIPVAAISSRAEELSVTTDDGTERSISVVASSDGMAVVTGLAAGSRVRIEPQG